MEPRELRLAVSRLENERRRSLRKEFLQLDIPLGQGQPRLLECLLRTGPRNQRELGEECGVDPSTLSRSVDRLVEAGLVTRTQDPDCRRCQKVTLTESGRRAAERVSARFEKMDAAFRAQLSETECRQFLDMLERLRRTLQDPAEGPDE